MSLPILPVATYAVMYGFGWSAASLHAARRNRLRNNRVPQPPKAICGCGHHYAVHDGDGCHTVARQVTARSGPIKDVYGNRIIGYKEETFGEIPCPCKRYTGPEPLTSYYAPEISE